MGTTPVISPEFAPIRRQARSRASIRSFRVVRCARPVVVAAGCLITIQLIIRGWAAGSGFFYWDDLVLVGRAARYPLFSTDLLLCNHDGHFMPLAYITAWILTAVMPLVWVGPVMLLLVMQDGVSVAVLRMLIVLMGIRWTILIPLVFYLFSPVTLPAFLWWAAALNALPLQFALAWVIGDAMLLVRTGRHRHTVSGIAVLIVALLFFEKAVIVPFTGFAVATLAYYVGHRRAAVAVVARRGAALWAGAGVVLGCWLVGYRSVVDASAIHLSPGQLRNLLGSAISSGVVPTLLGGPWEWARWLPSTPWATPPGWAVVSGWAALGASVALSIYTRRRVAAVWLLVSAYVVAAQLPVALVRGGPNTAAELMQSLRYLADTAVILTAAGALILRARPRVLPGWIRVWLPGHSELVTLMTVFLLSSLWSTYTFVQSWRVNPARMYITNAKAAFGEWDGVPLLEQEVPWDVLSPLMYPQNLASRVLAPIAAPGTFATSTPRLRMITATGGIADAKVWWNRSIRPGPERSCGYRAHDDVPAQLILDGPMIEREWTAQVNYLANRDGQITVSFEYGDALIVPVTKGLNTVFVRLTGSGSALRIGSHTPGLDLCIGSGPVGVASYEQ